MKTTVPNVLHCGVERQRSSASADSKPRMVSARVVTRPDPDSKFTLTPFTPLSLFFSRLSSNKIGLIAVVLVLIAVAEQASLGASQFGSQWQSLSELERAERLIKFACFKSLVNTLVSGNVSVTKRYQDASTGINVSYQRYENAAAWVDLESKRKWAEQEDRRGYFTVRRAGIKRIAAFEDIAFLDNAARSAVRQFFLKKDFLAAMRTMGNVDIIPGEVAEISFIFEQDKLRSIGFDCSL